MRPRSINLGRSVKHWSPERLGIVLALLAALGFSLKAIFVKLAYAWPVSAVTLLAIRMLLSLPVFAYVGWRAGQEAEPIARRDWLALAALGLLGYYGASILDFIGLQYISAGLERLILFTYPTLTILIGVFAYGRQLHRREVAAIVLSYLGIAAAFAHDLGLSSDSHAVWLGAGFVFGSSLSYALYLSGSGSMIARLGSARFTALAMLFSTAGTLVHFGITEPLATLEQPWPVLGYGAAMALFSTVLPVFMQSAAIRRIGPSRSVLIGTLGPILTIFFGWWWLGEAVSLAQMLGAGLVLVGVLLVSWRR